MTKLSELLMIEDILTDPEEQAQKQAESQAAQGGAPVPPGQNPAGVVDTVSSGALPPGAEPAAVTAESGDVSNSPVVQTPVLRGKQGFPVE